MTDPAPRRRGSSVVPLLAVGLIGIGCLLGVALSLVSRGQERLEVAEKEAQGQRAIQLAETAAGEVAGLRRQIEAIARTFEIATEGRTVPQLVKRLTKEDELERLLRDDDRLLYLAVADESGQAAFSGLDLPDQAVKDFLKEAYLRGQAGRAMVSVPFVADSLQEAVLVVEEPIAGGEGVAGVVLAVVSPQGVARAAADAAEKGLAEAFVVDDRGWVLVHSDPDVAPGTDLSGQEALQRFRLAETSHGMVIPYSERMGDGETRSMLGSVSPLRDASGWSAVIVAEGSRAFYDSEIFRRTSLALVGIVTAAYLVLVGLLAWWLRRRAPAA